MLLSAPDYVRMMITDNVPDSISVVAADDDDDDDPQVSLGCQQRKLAVPDDPRRFDSCVSVLGKQSFTSGKHYWVVQVGNQAPHSS